MPATSTRTLLFFKFLFCIALALSLSNSRVLAATDPLSATVSATARIPSTTATTADTTAPLPVILVAPIDGAMTRHLRPEFVWKTTTDQQSNIIHYTLRLDSVETFLGISGEGNSQQHNYVAHVSDGHIFLTPTFDLSLGTHTWLVSAYDQANNTSYSALWRFTIDTAAPNLTLTNIDDIYFTPQLTEGSIFDLYGPQVVDLYYQTESWATVSLTIASPSTTPYNLAITTQQDGKAHFALDLPLGKTNIITSSFDPAGLTSVLPSYSLSLTARPVQGGISRQLPDLFYQSPNIPPSIRSLPSKIASISLSGNITKLLIILLAVTLLILIIVIWNRRNNILIIDSRTSKPFRSLNVYHSIPSTATRIHSSARSLYLTTHEPLRYNIASNGQAFIPKLGRYSCLTIRTPANATILLSLSTQRTHYTLVL